MPRHGMFARVLRGGELAAGMPITTDAELDRQRYAVVTLSDSRARRAKAKRRPRASSSVGARSVTTSHPSGRSGFRTVRSRSCRRTPPMSCRARGAGFRSPSGPVSRMRRLLPHFCRVRRISRASG